MKNPVKNLLKNIKKEAAALLVYTKNHKTRFVGKENTNTFFPLEKYYSLLYYRHTAVLQI